MPAYNIALGGEKVAADGALQDRVRSAAAHIGATLRTQIAVVMRHGDTRWTNEIDRRHGSLEAEQLSPYGREQAYRLANVIGGIFASIRTANQRFQPRLDLWGPHDAHCNQMSRIIDQEITRSPITQRVGRQVLSAVHLDRRLAPIRLGPMNGMRPSDIARTYPEIAQGIMEWQRGMRPWAPDPPKSTDSTGPQSETVREFTGRFETALDNALSRSAGQIVGFSLTSSGLYVASSYFNQLGHETEGPKAYPYISEADAQTGSYNVYELLGGRAVSLTGGFVRPDVPFVWPGSRQPGQPQLV